MVHSFAHWRDAVQFMVIIAELRAGEMANLFW